MDVLTLARWQFGITTIYHFFFVPLTIGLSFLVAIMESYRCFISASLCSLPIRLGGKQIADADLGEDVARVSRIRLQLASQSVDVHLEHVALPTIPYPPDVL